MFISFSGSFVPGGDVFHFLSFPLRVGEFNQASKKDYAASHLVFHIPIYFSIIFNFNMTTGQSVLQHISVVVSRNRTKRIILNSELARSISNSAGEQTYFHMFTLKLKPKIKEKSNSKEQGHY
jgi:hypothetical protein